jgi:hypothetical protein
MHNVIRHERVHPLLQTRVVVKVICSVDDGNAVVVATSGGEEDLRRRKTVWRGDLCYGGRFRHWSSSTGVDNGEVGAGQTTQGFL